MIKNLSKNHKILVTTRDYNELNDLVKVQKFKAKIIGKHGGVKTTQKLTSSLDRMNSLNKIIQKFLPDLTISFCSPEAARISFGLGKKHFAFSDSPHAKAVMKLTIPLIDKLFIPWVISKEKFTIYGIEKKNIVKYRALDANTTLTEFFKEKGVLNQPEKIFFRISENQASYSTMKDSKIIQIIKEIVREHGFENTIVLGRYSNQKKRFKKFFGKNLQIQENAIDSKEIWKNCKCFIGSGGTMTAEAALLGIPTISYNATPNEIENFLVKNNFIKREENPKKIPKLIFDLINKHGKIREDKAKKFRKSMEDPYIFLKKSIDKVNKK